MSGAGLTFEPAVVTALIIMGAVTLGLKVAGATLIRRLPPSPRLSRFLDALPATVMTAMVVPAALAAGPAGLAAVVASFAVMRRTGNMLLAAGAGLAIGLGLRMVV